MIDHNTSMQKRFLHRLNLETLEIRLPLAGNVLAMLDHGNLVIKGTDVANQISVTSSGAGSFTITGSDGTTVNGSPNATITGVTKDVQIDSRGGDDRLRVGNSGGGVLVVPRELEIKMGAGDDEVTVFHAKIGSELEMELGKGDDCALIAPSQEFTTSVEAQELEVDTGSGTDMVMVGSSSEGGNVTVHQDLEIEGDHGAKTVVIEQTHVGHDLSVETNRGADRIGIRDTTVDNELEIETGQYKDVMVGDGVTARDLEIQMGAGNDEVYGKNISVQHHVHASGGSGFDKIEAEPTGAQKTTLQKFESESATVTFNIDAFFEDLLGEFESCLFDLFPTIE